MISRETDQRELKKVLLIQENDSKSGEPSSEQGKENLEKSGNFTV